MEIYFLRHGDAEPEGERPLSDDGRNEVNRVARRLKRLDLELDAIFTSPLLRAKQTAEIVGNALHIEPIVSDLLDSGATIEDIGELLEQCAPEDKVMLVGHEPDFSTIIGQLIGSGKVRMKKAGLARVACDQVTPGAGLLKWLLTPKVIR